MTIETLTLYVGIITLIIGVAFFVINLWWTNRIAKKSGVYKKVDLDIYVDDYSLIQKQEFSNIIFGYSAEKDSSILCFLNFKILNNGEL